MISKLNLVTMKDFFKTYWWVFVIASFFVPVNRKADGTSERLSGFLVRQTLSAVAETFESIGINSVPVADPVPAKPVASAVQTPLASVPPTATTPVTSQREGVLPSSNLSPVTTITLEGGEKVQGQWLLAQDGGIAHHPNPEVAMKEIAARVPGDWSAVKQPSGKYHFFRRS